MTEHNPSPDPELFRVVINDEQQYSIWPEHKTVPAGWAATGFRGDKSACLTHIKQVWTDITPRSVRES